MRLARFPLALTLAALPLLASTGCTSPAADEPAAPAAVPAKAAVVYDDHGEPAGLHQYNPYTANLTSGAQPEGDVAFSNLKALGYTTILSVDGALPDVESAKKVGLRYIHVPIQYSGVKPEEIAEVAKAIETADGPIYVHCHHGKHRSPAALSAACVSLGILTPEQGVAEMKVSGTDPKYQGLYRDVMGAKPISKADLAKVGPLREQVKPDDLATAMVEVDKRWDFLKASKAANWSVPADNADIDPPHEARMLWEQYREIARLPESAKKGEAFAKFLSDGEASAKALEDALRAKDTKATDDAFARGMKSCSGCHAKYRDN